MVKPFEWAVESLVPNSVYAVGLIAVLGLGVLLARRAGRARWPGWLRTLSLLLMLWAYALSTPGVARLLLDPLEQAQATVDLQKVGPGGDVIVLASGSVERLRGFAVVRLDRAAWERAAAGAALWQRTQARLIVVGGPAVDGLSPAKAMAQVAMAMGVPADRIVVNDKPSNTRESFQSFQETGTAKPWLVTSASHMPRALWSAEQQGLSPRAFPCDYQATDAPGWRQWLPASGAYRPLVTALHEWVGLAYYHWQAL